MTVNADKTYIANAFNTYFTNIKTHMNELNTLPIKRLNITRMRNIRISNVIEKIMYSQLDNFFKTQKYVYDNQYGFRTEHSTEFAALELADRVITCMDHNDTPINIYLDLSKEFDTLDHEIFLAKLQHYGILGTPLELVKSH